MRRGRAAVAAVAALAVVGVLGGAPGEARADTTSARLGLLTGFRFQIGSLADDYAYAPFWDMIGFEAALLPVKNQGGTLRFGPAWWTLISVYPASSASAVDATLSTTEMGLGGRLHWQVPLVRLPVTVHAQAGVEVLRAGVPILAEGQQTFVGGAVGGGAEVHFGDFMLGLTVHVAPIGDGPGAASLFVTAAFGRP